jgi:hypothetical protein
MTPDIRAMVLAWGFGRMAGGAVAAEVELAGGDGWQAASSARAPAARILMLLKVISRTLSMQ